MLSKFSTQKVNQ